MSALLLAFYLSCGPQPMPHVPPPNCKRVDSQCICDENGRSCRWAFICVPHDQPGEKPK